MLLSCRGNACPPRNACRQGYGQESRPSLLVGASSLIDEHIRTVYRQHPPPSARGKCALDAAALFFWSRPSQTPPPLPQRCEKQTMQSSPTESSAAIRKAYSVMQAAHCACGSAARVQWLKSSARQACGDACFKRRKHPMELSTRRHGFAIPTKPQVMQRKAP